MPLSTTLILAWLLKVSLAALEKTHFHYEWALIPVALGLIIYPVYRGYEYQQKYDSSYRVNKIRDAMDYVRQTMKPGDVYLIPPDDAEFDDFRLYTGAPIFINWKSHPYKDTEVLEWYRRLQLAEKFYAASETPGACQALQDVASQDKITHVVLKTKLSLDCPSVKEVFRYKNYVIYELTG